MPLLAGFCLVAFFIWAAENLGTFATVWVYPHQRHGWRLVGFGKFGAWLLLLVISFILVSFAHSRRRRRKNPAEGGSEARSVAESGSL